MRADRPGRSFCAPSVTPQPPLPGSDKSTSPSRFEASTTTPSNRALRARPPQHGFNAGGHDCLQTLTAVDDPVPVGHVAFSIDGVSMTAEKGHR